MGGKGLGGQPEATTDSQLTGTAGDPDWALPGLPTNSCCSEQLTGAIFEMQRRLDGLERQTWCFCPSMVQNSQSVHGLSWVSRAERRSPKWSISSGAQSCSWQCRTQRVGHTVAQVPAEMSKCPCTEDSRARERRSVLPSSESPALLSSAQTAQVPHQGLARQGEAKTSTATQGPCSRFQQPSCH